MDRFWTPSEGRPDWADPWAALRKCAKSWKKNAHFPRGGQMALGWAPLCPGSSRRTPKHCKNVYETPCPGGRRGGCAFFFQLFAHFLRAAQGSGKSGLPSEGVQKPIQKNDTLGEGTPGVARPIWPPPPSGQGVQKYVEMRRFSVTALGYSINKKINKNAKKVEASRNPWVQ